MRESLAELFRELETVVPQARDATQGGRHELASALVRRILSAGSKLHTRLSILAELEDDANFVAEVDRALKREQQSGPPLLPGDTPLPFAPPGEPSPAPKRRRGGKAGA